MSEEIEKVKILIIGSGPAGYTAAIYTARAGLNPVLYQGLQPGGQLTITSDVENFPGFPQGIGGPELMELMQKQAEKFNTQMRFGIISKVDFSKRPFMIFTDDEKQISAETVIIATGATARWLGLESERRLAGSGVSACAQCDGFFYKGQDVAIVGGGDTAAEEASYLAGICKTVYLIHRRNELRASKYMQEKVSKISNIKILYSHIIKEILGEKSVEGVLLEDIKNKKEVKLNIQGFFVAIGHHPNTEIFKGQLDTNENGYIITKPGTTQTSVKGVFAAGDVQDEAYRQAITAAGSGCMAALEVEKFLCAPPN
ncbi:MAG: thioredoxin-disulfide reductase [Bacteroidales bacterium]|nr:thioredoxin-disulfide reductase [Bacteroidales bacterium]